MSRDLIRAEEGGHLHWCPGCKFLHVIPARPNGWTFNGSFERPTFSPSVKHTWNERGDGGLDKCCHYFIEDGNIRFCGDCTHTMAGAVVPLTSIEAALAEREAGA